MSEYFSVKNVGCGMWVDMGKGSSHPCGFGEWCLCGDRKVQSLQSSHSSQLAVNTELQKLLLNSWGNGFEIA